MFSSPERDDLVMCVATGADLVGDEVLDDVDRPPLDPRTSPTLTHHHVALTRVITGGWY